MTISRNFLIATLVAVAAIVALYAITAHANVTDHGLPSHVGTSSPMVVGPLSANTLFTASSNCEARIITTVAQPIMLSFTSQLTPTALVGHLQAASTTVAYDNLTYGCGAVTAYGYTASSSITVTQTVQ